MTLPRNDEQAKQRYGVALLPVITYWRERLARGCERDPSLSELARVLRSDLFESLVFRELCDWLERTRPDPSFLSREVLTRHTLLAAATTLGARGYAAQVRRLVELLSPR